MKAGSWDSIHVVEVEDLGTYTHIHPHNTPSLIYPFSYHLYPINRIPTRLIVRSEARHVPPDDHYHAAYGRGQARIRGHLAVRIAYQTGESYSATVLCIYNLYMHCMNNMFIYIFIHEYLLVFRTISTYMYNYTISTL